MPEQTHSRKALYVLFFLSGAVALVYQVVWTRLLTLFFGSTILAVSTVLAVFMAGLAIGSALFGKMADRAAEPVRFYGVLELGIGLLAVATPLVFSLIERIFLSVHQSAAPGPWQAALLRFALSSLLLLPPTIMMGGTLPVLSKVFLEGHGSNTGRSISALYFINTFGAVVGTVASGMFLLQILGIQWLLVLGGAVNAAIFVFADRMPPVRLPVPEGGSPESLKEVPPPSRWSRDALLAVVALFLSGMAALVYEVAWTRVLTLVIGSSTYAFTIMLATFLSGIAFGSALVGRYFRFRKPGTTLLAVCQILIGIFAVATAALFGQLPDAFVSLFGALGERFGWFLAGNFLLCFVVMVPATIFMGASFPVASALVVENFGSSGRRIGLLYAGNTVGAILGAFLAGFVLLPSLGIQRTLILTVFVNLSCGLLLCLFFPAGKTPAGKAILPAVAVVLILFLSFGWRPGWDTLKMTSGPYAYAVQYQKIPIERRLSRIEQLYYREGPIATVSVIQEGRHRRLVVDGKTDAGNFRDMTTQVIAGHLPLLVRPTAEDVLIVGYASGITAGAVSCHEVRRIDCVEIEPAMREASRFFDEENYRVIEDPRFRLIIDDARSFVLGARKRYDIIVSEPSNPWQAGSSRLFTREAFLNAKEALKDGGIMAQWMHLYGVDVETFRLVARTFLSVFPHVTLWMDPEYADVILLGSSAHLAIDPPAIDRLFRENPRVRGSLSRIGYPEAPSFLRAFVLGEEETKRFAGTGDRNTDNLPHLEFRAPKSLYSATALRGNVGALLAAKSYESFPSIEAGGESAQATASILKGWGIFLAQHRSLEIAKGALAEAVKRNPSDAEVRLLLEDLRMGTGGSR